MDSKKVNYAIISWSYYGALLKELSLMSLSFVVVSLWILLSRESVRGAVCGPQEELLALKEDPK